MAFAISTMAWADEEEIGIEASVGPWHYLAECGSRPLTEMLDGIIMDIHRTE